MNAACTNRNEAAGGVSFAAWIRSKFLDQLIDKLAEHTALRNIELIRAVLTDVIVTGTERDIVYANVYFDCTVKEAEHQSKKPYVVDCYLDTCDGFSQLRIRCISPDWPTYQAAKAVPDTLIPDLPKAQLEAVATKILKELYPSALRNAIPVPASVIAHKLGLSVQYACIDTDGEVLGKIFFEDSTTAVQDAPGGISRILNVARGTILVNERPNGRCDTRAYSNTIAHECVHWLLHRQAYQLQKADDPQLTSIACRRSSALKRSREWTPQERMEWQANALAPRILMPEWSTRMLTDQWLRRMEKLDPKYRMDRIVEKLSCHYEVSRSLARIRLIELGYPDAELGFTAPTQYEISYTDATREFAQKPKFRDVLASGAYAYVDQRFCLRNSRYISRAEDGALHLTEYAKAHPAECCIGFDVQRRARWANDGMFRDRRKVAQFAEAASEEQRFLKTVQEVSRVMKSLPVTFGSTLESHMQRKGLTQEQLAESSLLAARTIRSYQSTEAPSIGLPRVVALCIGLKLHPIFCFDMVRKAGYRFNLTEEHVAYQMLLGSMTHSPIYECNEYLRAAGIPPLGKEE
jgi:Zn-dependent peptidase ImmA (M78 family)